MAVGDFDADGKPEAFKASENESPHPMNHVLRPGNQPSVVLAVLAVAGITVFVAGDPAQPAALQPCDYWHKCGWNVDQQVTMSALPFTAFMHPKP